MGWFANRVRVSYDERKGIETLSICLMESQLREYPLAELIREISAGRLSGALRLARERVKAVIYAEAGEIIFASSNLRAHRLAECLRRWGMVSDNRLATAVEGMSDIEAGEALVAAGAISKENLKELQARQAMDVLRPMLLWTDGTWVFDPRSRLGGDVRITIEVHQLLLESARRLPVEFITARMTNDHETLSPANEAPTNLQLLPPEAFVLSRIDAPVSLGELVAISGLSEPETRQIIYTLALCGFIHRENWPRPFSEEVLAQARIVSKARETVASAGAATNQAADPHAEIYELFMRADNTDYYEILGVNRSANTSEIKHAYYALAKRFHPDRFGRDIDEEMRVRIENAFAQIARAYETLKDWRARDAYNLKLDAQALRPAQGGATDVDKVMPKPADDSASQQVFTTTAASVGGSSPAPQQRQAEESFRQGLMALKQGNHALALTKFGEAARLVPNEARYRAFYGRALAHNARMRHQAEAELQAAIALDARNPTYRVMLAQFYRDLGQLLRAENELQRVLSIDPQHAAALRMLDSLKNRG